VGVKGFNVVWEKKKGLLVGIGSGKKIMEKNLNLSGCEVDKRQDLGGAVGDFCVFNWS
jgi:hypothetical protein